MPPPEIDNRVSYVNQSSYTVLITELVWFRFHRKDVLDLQWSTDGAFLISGSVDNSCIIWDVNKGTKGNTWLWPYHLKCIFDWYADYPFYHSLGSVHQILDAHLHYVQGVAWDPQSKYVASLSSDRSCRIYVNKPQNKTKGIEKMNYVCQHVITKSEQQMTDDSKVGNWSINFCLL